MGWWPAGGGVVSMVRFSLGGAHRCGCGWAGPFHQPQGLEGVVIQALLREKALCRVQQQQVLTHEKNREGAPECTRQPEHPDSKQAKTLLKLRLLPLSNAAQDRYRELTSNLTIHHPSCKNPWRSQEKHQNTEVVLWNKHNTLGESHVSN